MDGTGVTGIWRRLVDSRKRNGYNQNIVKVHSVIDLIVINLTGLCLARCQKHVFGLGLVECHNCCWWKATKSVVVDEKGPSTFTCPLWARQIHPDLSSFPPWQILRRADFLKISPSLASFRYRQLNLTTTHVNMNLNAVSLARCGIYKLRNKKAKGLLGSGTFRRGVVERRVQARSLNWSQHWGDIFIKQALTIGVTWI